jgi:hypothetical protein
MKKSRVVALTEAERQMLQEMLSHGTAACQEMMHPKILATPTPSRCMSMPLPKA